MQIINIYTLLETKLVDYNLELHVIAAPPDSTFTQGHECDGCHPEDTVYTASLQILKPL